MAFKWVKYNGNLILLRETANSYEMKLLVDWLH